MHGQGLTTPADMGVILNSMVQYQPVDRTLAALADPTRRQILERLSRAPQRSASWPAAWMTLTGVKKHVRCSRTPDS